jgi:uncharacterized membrane protein
MRFETKDFFWLESIVMIFKSLKLHIRNQKKHVPTISSKEKLRKDGNRPTIISCTLTHIAALVFVYSAALHFTQKRSSQSVLVS